MQAICQTNTHLLIQTLRERHVLKMNYSTDTVHVIGERVHAHHSLVTSILLSCHNQISRTTQIPRPYPDFGPFPDFSPTLANFPDISRFPEIPQKKSKPPHTGLSVYRPASCVTHAFLKLTYA